MPCSDHAARALTRPATRCPVHARSVSVRVRPLNRQEQAEGFAWKIDNNCMFQVDPQTQEPERCRDARYTLDHIFSPRQSTREIYSTTTQGLIQKLVHGFNRCAAAAAAGAPVPTGVRLKASRRTASLMPSMLARHFTSREACSKQFVVCPRHPPPAQTLGRPAQHGVCVRPD